MKIKEEYVLQNIVDKWVVIDTNGKSLNFNKILSLNDSGKFLWEKLENGADTDYLVKSLMDSFDVDKQLAQKDVEKFVSELKELGCLEDEK